MSGGVLKRYLYDKENVILFDGLFLIILFGDVEDDDGWVFAHVVSN